MLNLSRLHFPVHWVNGCLLHSHGSLDTSYESSNAYEAQLLLWSIRHFWHVRFSSTESRQHPSCPACAWILQRCIILERQIATLTDHPGGLMTVGNAMSPASHNIGVVLAQASADSSFVRMADSILGDRRNARNPCHRPRRYSAKFYASTRLKLTLVCATSIFTISLHASMRLSIWVASSSMDSPANGHGILSAAHNSSLESRVYCMRWWKTKPHPCLYLNPKYCPFLFSMCTFRLWSPIPLFSVVEMKL